MRANIIKQSVLNVVNNYYTVVVDFDKKVINVKLKKMTKIPFALRKVFNSIPALVDLQGYWAAKIAETEKNIDVFSRLIRNTLPSDVPLYILEYKEIFKRLEPHLTMKLKNSNKLIPFDEEIFSKQFKDIKLASKTANIDSRLKTIFVHISNNITEIRKMLEKSDDPEFEIKAVTYSFNAIKEPVYGTFAFGIYNTNYIFADNYNKVLKSDPSMRGLVEYFNIYKTMPYRNDNPKTINLSQMKRLSKKYRTIFSFGSLGQYDIILLDKDYLTNILSNVGEAFVMKIIDNLEKGYMLHYQNIYIFDDDLETVLSNIYEQYFDKDFDNFIKRVKANEQNKKIDKTVINNLPKTGFTVDLYTHQQLAVSWLYNTYKSGLPGAILADDMGLGKTPTTIAFLSLIQKANPKYKITIISPASMVGAWESEIEKFSPELKNYQVMSYERALRSVPATDILVMDEAQKVKNDTTQLHKLLSNLDKKFTVVLTGTPIENKLEDIINILSIINPPFARLKNLKRLTLNFAAELRKLIDGIFLQRKKQDVKNINLSAKLKEQFVLVNPTKNELDLISSIKKIYSDQIDRLKAQNNFEFYEAQVILVGLMRIRQAISCPRQLSEDVLKYIPNNIKANIKNEIPSKMKKLKDICSEAVKRKEKIVVFAEFSETIRCMKDYLSKDFRVAVLTGSDSSEKRKQTVADFQDGKYDVFIVALKAGNSGITLHAANNVVVYDLWYNPQVLAQAIARVHRIGQNKDVNAYYLVDRGTFDERIQEILERKKELINKFEGNEVNKSNIKDIIELGKKVFK